MKKVFKWIGMFFLLWGIGMVLGVTFDLGFALIGHPITEHTLGLFILLFIVFGLIIYGATRK